jgi:hypothetical protein
MGKYGKTQKKLLKVGLTYIDNGLDLIIIIKFITITIYSKKREHDIKKVFEVFQPFFFPYDFKLSCQEIDLISFE